ncbi:hypothetical protein ACU4GD_32495 [Cupriavidus basilensis]
MLPRTVVYDPELTLGLPMMLSVTSGINAIAHAAEGLYAGDANPVTSVMAARRHRGAGPGRCLQSAARTLVATRLTCCRPAATRCMARGSCGSVLANVGMSLHHKLCHTLGGTFNLAHAEVHTIVLPHALAYNAGAPHRKRLAAVASALGAGSAPQASFDLARDSVCAGRAAGYRHAGRGSRPRLRTGQCRTSTRTRARWKKCDPAVAAGCVRGRTARRPERGRNRSAAAWEMSRRH